MKKLALLGGLALSLMASSLFAADKPLRLGIEAAYPPFAFKQADGSIAGFDVDIGVALCAEMKVECQWVEQEFDGLIPALDFTCQRCLWNKSNLGRVTLQARPSAKADRLDIPRFSLNNGGSKLNGSGNWRLDGGQSLSSLRIALDTPSLERQLTEWGVDQGLTGTPAKGELSINWQGPIYRLDKPTLQGNYRLTTEAGLLRRLDTPGTRLLSLLSLNGVMRRLSLDFSDVFEKGFYFKRIAFSGKVSNGVLDKILMGLHLTKQPLKLFMFLILPTN